MQTYDWDAQEYADATVERELFPGEFVAEYIKSIPPMNRDWFTFR